MEISKAEREDAAEILELQYLSYQSEAQIYNDYTIQPLMQNLSELEEELERHFVLKAVISGKIVGSVRAYQENQVCKIGKLIVHPDHQSTGIGTTLLNAIEQQFGSCRKYELFTGEKSQKNLYLYAKLGFKPCRKVEVDRHLTIIYLEKERKI
ncbi:N-acetylglutamate synthase, GNAT family [Paenibacillus sophorae]|uniref:GNAT family N-acetyltransferase n=1 Tax=Paenibacillus sophorae TaxID=1333845 RepID=A0A1H8QU94_9BACL|nr:GNAT family N-acetyltransferase [Paenibacillus sophorae]QWU14836.1 GNAT family N-acetyltransferase [Paenibacillus sophorae]SEO57752.1 N-acetylglutamate synthase, GNAT family [Paenibacillus sophorae]